MKQTFEEFKEKYKDTSYENILHQFYFEHNDLLELNQANELLFKKNQILKNKIQNAIKYIGNPLDNYWEVEAQHLLDILKGGKNEI